MITSIDIYELAIEQISIYRDREISEKQIESVQVKDAGNDLYIKDYLESFMKFITFTVPPHERMMELNFAIFRGNSN